MCVPHGVCVFYTYSAATEGDTCRLILIKIFLVFPWTTTMQSNNNTITYADGPVLVFTRPVSKSQYIDLCEALSQRFNDHFALHSPGGNRYDFHPESITEGGLYLLDFPGKRGEMYKSMRHFIKKKTPPSDAVKWPHIQSQLTVLLDWTYACDQTLIPKSAAATTTLKAYYGAPVWTLVELGLMRQVFAQFGIKCQNMPSNTSLSRDAM